MDPISPWKKPDEVMQLHRLKKRKRALQERMKQPQAYKADQNKGKQEEFDFSKIINGEKRRNPFSKNDHESKRLKPNVCPPEESSDNTLFELLKLSNKPTPVEKPSTDKLATFSNLLQKYTANHTAEIIPETKYKYIPIDWALKTKVRLMSPKPFAWNQHLKASEEASGITGFVRCLDTTSSSSLDTSPRARLHQNCLYWQHPQLPWLSLYPRQNTKQAATSLFATNESVKLALHRDWADSFSSLFQLLRARHCPYFYVCANSFTCLFRAAGLCGMSEPCALISPTTRGFRQALRQEDVEFTMPLRPDGKRQRTTSDDGKAKNSFDSCSETMDDMKSNSVDQTTNPKEDPNSGDEEDLDSDKFLSQMGFDADDIKRINHSQARVTNTAESSVDSAAQSLVLARGVDAQALFNFLLNCKSIVSPTGPYAGVPPTLLAPTAFHGGTLMTLKIRESTIQVSNSKYYSMEICGPMLPTTLHTLLGVLKQTCSEQVSATFAHLPNTLAFTWAAKSIAKEENSIEKSNNSTKAFHKENLSDSGINEDLLQHFCSNDPDIVKCIDSIKYTIEDDSFTW